MLADFPAPQTAAPTLEKAAPAGPSLQTASCQYVHKRYGELGTAMTANVITYRGKSAAREVAKALGFDQESLATFVAKCAL
jgi:error-prone DNA polymerase